MTTHVIFGAVLKEVRARDGAQHFQSQHRQVPKHLRDTWLVGIDRIQDAEVGMRGRLVYRREANRAYYSFIRED